jgi:hypothetical protein
MQQATVNPAGNPKVTDTTGPRPSGEPGEFERFEELAGKLVQVSKGELDEKLKKG